MAIKTHPRAVIIGGGIIGVATAYHLASHKGWGEVVLLERKDLTSGSTWHAAGLLPLFNLSYSMAHIHQYSIDFYQRLAKQTKTEIGFRQVGNIRLANRQDRWDEYMHYVGIAETMGVETQQLTPKQIKELWPLCNTDDITAGLYHPQDGYIQPADVTQALAKQARGLGVDIVQNTKATAITRTKTGEWRVTTSQGDIVAEHVVLCTGNFARATGRMLGLATPVIPMEHQYIVTEPHPALQARTEQGLPELAVLRDNDMSWYLREEAGGFLLGPYEASAPPCYVNDPSDSSAYELFQEDVGRIEREIESAMVRVPEFGTVGVKKIYNGAIAYTPDGNPIIGPAPGLRNVWLNEGHSAGIVAAGGAGWQLAEWICHGEPSIDMAEVDPRRYGDFSHPTPNTRSHAGRGYLLAKNQEAYANMFTIHYPNEEREAGRPLRTSPCHQRLEKLGAVFGGRFGWERANWFAPKGVPASDEWSFRRVGWWEYVGEEVKHVAEHVGVLDMTPFAKARVAGAGAAKFLNRVMASRLPKEAGRIGLGYALTAKGGVHSEFTILREGEMLGGRLEAEDDGLSGSESFYLTSAAALHNIDHDWLRRHMPRDNAGAGDDRVTLTDLTNSMGVLVVAGPKARDLMQRVSPGFAFANADFPWLTAQWIEVGLAPVLALRVNFVGELGWELHHPIEYQNHIFDCLMREGEGLGLKPFGMRAMDAMRLEKSYGIMGHELSHEYAALECGVGRFIAMAGGNDKSDFIGKEGLLAWQKRGLSRQLVTLRVAAEATAAGKIAKADASMGNPIYHKGKMVGRVTSGNYGFRVGMSLAMGMVAGAVAKLGAALEVEILGKRVAAEVIESSPWDKDNARLRG